MLNKKEDTTKTAVIGFHIPSGRTLQAINERREMNMWEMNDYLKYIVSNYYLSVNEFDYLIAFTGDWFKHNSSIEKYNERKKQARSSVIYSLNKGQPINPVDALWLSQRIYVDDLDSARVRRITKNEKEGELDVYAETNAENPSIGKQMEQLKIYLRETNCTKPVDYNS